MGHYVFMAAFSFTVIGVGLFASLRPDGWRPTAWVAGLLPALLGVTSLISGRLVESWCGLGSRHHRLGVVFVAAAELTKDGELPTLLRLRGAVSESERA